MIDRANSLLFKPVDLGHITIKNRFMRSATNEYLADEEGLPKPELKNMLVNLARCNVGLIVSGCAYVSNTGRRSFKQSGLCRAAQANAWKPIINEIHKHGSKFIFQLYHAGVNGNPECNSGQTIGVPTQVSATTHTMTKTEIGDVISHFRNAADLAYHAGADGVQIHAGHHFLISNFLSPVFNQRNDEYGGTFEKRMRIVEEIIYEIRHTLPRNFMVSMKINTDDNIPNGLTPYDTARIVDKLQHSLDLIELSCGASIRSVFHEKYTIDDAKPENKDKILKYARESTRAYPYKENYNLEAVKFIRSKNPYAKLAIVGGVRKLKTMDDLVKNGVADMISMSRPFIRDPAIVMRFKAGTIDEPTCINCGACIFNLDKGMHCHVPLW